MSKRILPGIARLLNPRNKGHLMTQSPEYQQVAFQQLKQMKKKIQAKRINAHAVRRNATWNLLVGDRVRVNLPGEESPKEIMADVKACLRHTRMVVVDGCPDTTLKKGERPLPEAERIEPMTVPYDSCELVYKKGPEIKYEVTVDPFTGTSKKVPLSRSGEPLTRYNRLKHRQQQDPGKGATPKNIVEERTFWMSEERPFPPSLRLIDRTLPLWQQKSVRGGVLSLKRF